jgi:8-oxo-dGTP diphosphatase
LWAHRGRQIWWRLTGRSGRGALVALWSEGHILIIRESYREQWSLPGGGIRVGEDPVAAIIREAEEEIGIIITSDALRYLGEFEVIFENVVHRDHVFESQLAKRPSVRVDNREIMRAEWHTRETVLDMDLTPHLRRYLEGY